MAPTNKAKASGVSSSSFMDLKAELVKYEQEFSKNRGAKKPDVLVRGSKKPSAWARENKGVKDRAKRDIQLEHVSKPTLESARAILERKQKIYDQLRKGKTGGLSDKQVETLLVDFDQKALDDMYESDSDDVDESSIVPQRPTEDDPIVEYEDEFGRMRTARKSEVPRHLAPPSPGADPIFPDDDPDIIYNPVNHFPVYEPTQERLQEIAEAFSEESNPLNIHYDAASEVRAKGAAFYQFSADEETRKQQMEELRMAREETERTRQEVGAENVKVGSVEGINPDAEGLGAGASTVKSRAMEKRKRELEERRRMVEAKRRKIKSGADGTASFAVPAVPVEIHAGDSGHVAAAAAEETAPKPSDPFTALEVQSSNQTNSPKSKGKDKAKVGRPPATAADDFLAQLEQDMAKRRQ